MTEPWPPIESALAARWKPFRSGPPESRLTPESRLLRWWFTVVNRLPRPWDAFLRAAALHTLRPKEVIVRTSWGGRLACGYRDHTFFRAHCGEPLETAIVCRLVRPGDTVVDAGANRGWYTILLSHLVGPAGRVLAFEPDPRARAMLERSLAANTFTRNVRVFSEALGDTSGSRSFVLSPQPSLSHLSHAETAPDPSDAHAPSVTVRTASLSEILVQENVVDLAFVKVDVEGGEPALLRGLRPALERGLQPSLLVEAEERLSGESPEQLASAAGPGYDARWLCRGHGRLERLNERCRVGRSLVLLPDSRPRPPAID